VRTSTGTALWAVVPVLALAASAAYFLLVGDLPEVDGDAGRYAAGCAGAVAIGLAALSPLAGRDDYVALLALGLGAALLATALNGQEIGAAANPVEVLFAAAAGMLFALAFGIPAAVVALPVLVAGIDAASVLTGPDEPLGDFDPVDVLTFDLPAFGGERPSIARIGFLDATFLAMFAAWSLRFALRPRIAIPLMVAGLAGSVALAVALDRAIPALPFVAAAFLLPALDRLLGLLRTPDEE
jgi:hypothetical protein